MALIKAISPEFEVEVQRFRQQFLKDTGINLTFIQATEMMSKTLRSMEFDFGDMFELPKSLDMEFTLNVKRKKGKRR